MQNDDIIKILKSRLDEIVNSKLFEDNYSKAHIAGIYTALYLYEIATLVERKIPKVEQRWFDGGYQVARLLDYNEWRDISLLYGKICDKAKEYFES